MSEIEDHINRAMRGIVASAPIMYDEVKPLTIDDLNKLLAKVAAPSPQPRRYYTESMETFRKIAQPQAVTTWSPTGHAAFGFPVELDPSMPPGAIDVLYDNGKRERVYMEPPPLPLGAPWWFPDPLLAELDAIVDRYAKEASARDVRSVVASQRRRRHR